MAPTGITRITVPTPFRIGPVNSWLARGTDAIAVFDVGPNHPPSLEALVAGLAAEGLQPQDVDLIVLTHQHYDHVGLAATMRELCGAELATLEALVPFLRDGRAANEAEDAFAVEVMRLHGVPEEIVELLWDHAQGRWHLGCSSPVDRPLADGSVLDLGGLALRVLHRPGHSPTDTIFVDEAAGEAIVGDHLLGSISSNPILHRPLDIPVDARRRPQTLIRYLDSMQRTAELGLRRTLGGHRDPVEDVPALVALRHREHAERKEDIFAALGEGPRTAYELTRVIWRRLPDDQVYLAVCEILGHVDLLAAEGRAVETEDADGVVRIARV